jgi:hypothetical protein
MGAAVISLSCKCLATFPVTLTSPKHFVPRLAAVCILTPACVVPYLFVSAFT